MKILITGGDTSLSKELSKIYDNVLIPNLDELDLTNKKNIEEFFTKENFDVIIHNESLLNVRLCEEQKDLATKINVTSTKNLIDVIQNKIPNVQFIHLSTPCVFDGSVGMYTESSIPKPVNFYGLTRLYAEKEVQKLKQYVIIRTNYVDVMKWPYPKAFTDRFGTYLFTKQVAEGIYDVQKEGITGIIHLANNTKISMYDLAKMTTPDIEPMTIDDYSGPPVTMDMSLDSKRWKKYNILLDK